MSKINKLAKELIDTNKLQPGDIENLRQFWLTVHGATDFDLENGRFRVTGFQGFSGKWETPEGITRTGIPLTDPTKSRQLRTLQIGLHRRKRSMKKLMRDNVRVVA